MAPPTPVTVLLIPGLSSKATVYDPLLSLLQATPTIARAQALSLPSTSAPDPSAAAPPTALERDAQAIRAAAQHAAAQGHAVVLVAHSYGGTPALHATAGLWRGGARGPGVARVLLLSGSLGLAGEAVGGVRAAWAAAHPEAGIDDERGARVEIRDGVPCVVPLPEMWPRWFSDLPVEEQRRWGATLVPSALGAVASPVPESMAADPREWKIGYLICEEEDLAMPTAFQEYLVQRARDAGAEVETTRIKSGHFVQLSHTQEVADWVVENPKV